MRRPIARNLLKSRAELVVSDHSDRWFEDFRSVGATGTTEMGDLADADIILLCLPNAMVVQRVLLGEGGLLPLLSRGQTVVEPSTITYSATTEIGRALDAKGVAFLDAPISGMEARAVDGTLTVMCGGREHQDLWGVHAAVA